MLRVAFNSFQIVTMSSSSSSQDDNAPVVAKKPGPLPKLVAALVKLDKEKKSLQASSDVEKKSAAPRHRWRSMEVCMKKDSTGANYDS